MCKEYKQLTADQNHCGIDISLKQQVVYLKVGDAVIRAPFPRAVGVDTLTTLGHGIVCVDVDSCIVYFLSSLGYI